MEAVGSSSIQTELVTLEKIRNDDEKNSDVISDCVHDEC